jgi:hypothetical protein
VTQRERMKLYAKIVINNERIEVLRGFIASGKKTFGEDAYMRDTERTLAAALRLARMYRNCLTYEQLPLFSAL